MRRCREGFDSDGFAFGVEVGISGARICARKEYDGVVGRGSIDGKLNVS